MPKSPSIPTILALLAALAALLFAWFVPLPRLVLSEEEKAGERMPENRQLVTTARSQFEKDQSAYKAYISTNDVGASLTGLENAARAYQANNADSLLATALQNSAHPVVAYLTTLQMYAASGQNYLNTLRHYDDELMAWTRSLGTVSEALRPDTWPIVEYLKLYPPPTGQSSDYPGVTASDVATYTASLQSSLNAVSVSPPRTEPATAIHNDIARIRTAGRSIEYANGLNPVYQTILTSYDTKVQSLVAGSNANNLSSSRVAFATGLNLLLGAITLAGLAALFLATRPNRTESAS